MQEGAEVVGPSGDTLSDSTTHSQPVTQSKPSTSLGSSHTTIPPRKSKSEDPRVEEAYRILKDTYGSKTRDKSQAFGNHIASKHREYSTQTKAYVEHYINNILFDADLGKFEFEPSVMSTPISSFSDSSQNTLLHSVNTDEPPPNQTTTVWENLENSSQNIINTEGAEETRKTLVYYLNNFK